MSHLHGLGGVLCGSGVSPGALEDLAEATLPQLHSDKELRSTGDGDLHGRGNAGQSAASLSEAMQDAYDEVEAE